MRAIAHLGAAHFPPFAKCYTISIYPLRGKSSVKYLKFPTQQEMDRWNLNVGDKVQVERCLHQTESGKERNDLIFDVRKVDINPLTQESD